MAKIGAELVLSLAVLILLEADAECEAAVALIPTTGGMLLVHRLRCAYGSSRQGPALLSPSISSGMVAPQDSPVKPIYLRSIANRSFRHRCRIRPWYVTAPSLSTPLLRSPSASAPHTG